MRRLVFRTAVLMLASSAMALGALQNMPAHPEGNADAPPEAQKGSESSHVEFAELCGIANTASQSATGLSRSAEGEWSVVVAGKHPGPGANAAARVWHESSWMVDLHDAPGHSMHTGELCFAASGEIVLLTDDYMDITCGCVRYTAESFDESGKPMQYMQRFVSIATGEEIAAPRAARDFPEVFEFRRVEQLPFYSLVSR